jgi:hypothetical protein
MNFKTRVIPTLPAWNPAHTFLSCVFSAIMIASCVAILIEKVARSASLLLGVVILSSFAIPATAYHNALLPINIGLWARAGKAPALSGKLMVFEN